MNKRVVIIAGGVTLAVMLIAAIFVAGRLSVSPQEACTEAMRQAFAGSGYTPVTTRSYQSPTPSKWSQEYDAMCGALKVELLDMRVSKATSAFQYGNNLDLILRITNNSDKDMRGFVGTAYFYDIFGREIKKLKVSHDDALSAHVYVDTSDYTYELNPFIDADNTLASKSLDDVVFVFSPSKILFLDGSALGQ